MPYTDELKKELEIDCKNCYIIGTLATKLDSYPRIGEENESITIMRNSENVAFYIKALSDEPSIIKKNVNKEDSPESSLYIGIDTHNLATLPPEYRYTKDRKSKIEIIKEKFENKPILFTPHITFKDGREEPFKNIDIITIESDREVDCNKAFICIPKVNMDNRTFEQKLLEGSNLLLEDYNHFMYLPEYILCGEYLYSDFKSWDKHPENKKMWSCTKEQEKIKRIKLNLEEEEIKNKVIKGTHNLVFIESDYLLQNVDNKFEVDGEFIKDSLNYNEVEDDITNEVKFLKDLKQYTIENHLCYKEEDLYNFHISVKTNSLTIVAGMSGTGKTQLARAYSKVLGLSEEDGTLLFLPISPAYTEPEDLLGYLNTTNGLYMPSETGLVDLLFNAEKNHEKIYMVIFDEMNLSQVEYWFAPFMSLLELDEEARNLKLYSKNSICYNCEKYKSTVKIRNNIIFVGTVNLDETTKDFSDRLLDRANMVTLQKRKFSFLKEEQNNENNKIYKSTSYKFSTYSGWIKKYSNISEVYTSKELEFLDNLHDLISRHDSTKGVSFRIFEKIGSYLINIKDTKGNYIINRDDAIDIQIKQRLLTKLKGTERQFGNLIGTLSPNKDIPSNSELYDFFTSNDAKSISHFSLTIKEICRKAKELELYGYTN